MTRRPARAARAVGGAAAHPVLAPQAVVGLLDAADEDLARATAENPSLPAAVRESLVDHCLQAV
ncbi:hypothetical protein [Streptomyces sp. NPDC048349]|uniref:hypothetical protein n=1 Tax=Streptomyces sp. NPDC048349 TaxID=3155486 RepID=UPI00341A75FC